jgi:multidrug efflux pump subunit AcrA (membrane-fusion protein)
VLDDQARPLPEVVQTGLSDGVYTEISGGALKPGDRVIVAEASKIATPAAPMGPAAGPRRGMGF